MALPEMSTFSTFSSDPEETNIQVIFNTVNTIVLIYLQPIIILFGVIGNIVSFRLNNLPKYRHTTTCIYMKGLAISDSVALLL